MRSVFPVLLLAGAACTEAAPPAPTTPSVQTSGPPAGASPSAAAAVTSGEQQALIARGEKVYRSQCIACHNRDPHKDGATGPANWGASLALLEARVLRAEYPPGYTPKRKTKQMLKLPHLKNEIPALHAYLNAK